MHKILNDFQKIFNILKNVTPEANKNRDLQEKVLNDVGDLFNEVYYICKDKYKEQKNGLKTKDTKKFDYKKLTLTDDYYYESEEEKEQQTSKKLDKKEPPKKATKTDLREFNKWVKKKETGINLELFQKYFKIQKPSDMLKTLYTTNNRKENDDLVKSRLNDLKNSIENISEEEKEIEKPN